MKKITDKMRLDKLCRSAQITRLYSGRSSNRRFKTCAWRLIIPCEGDWHGLRQSIDASIRAEEEASMRPGGVQGVQGA